MREMFISVVSDALAARGETAITAARRAGLRRDAIRSIYRGRSPSIDRAADIAAALDLEFYIGPRRPAAGQLETNVTELRAAPAMEPVDDRELAELIARLADYWESLEVDAPGQRRLAVAIDIALRGAGERARPPLRRVVQWLGWRVIGGGRGASGAPDVAASNEESIR